jgi:nicotinamidase-related amidase
VRNRNAEEIKNVDCHDGQERSNCYDDGIDGCGFTSSHRVDIAVAVASGCIINLSVDPGLDVDIVIVDDACAVFNADRRTNAEAEAATASEEEDVET